MTLDLARHSLFITLAGSQAHGTAREGSDVDLRGVCVAPLPTRLSLFSSFEQVEGVLEGPIWEAILPTLRAHETASRGLSVKTESVIFDVAKFLGLAASANPNALEILFADERDWVHRTPAWDIIHENRARFLTQKVQQTYLGYALAQLKKIKTHRAWLLTPPKGRPTRDEFGLPDAGTLTSDDRNRIEQSIAEKIRSYGIGTLEMPKATRIAIEERLRTLLTDVFAAEEDQLPEKLRATATTALELPSTVVTTLDAERRYRAASKHWEAYQTWLAERNPARAELERRHGYDTKHAMHLVRLMRTGLEVIETAELRVRRPDAAELNEIRDGSLPYEQLLALAQDLETQMRQAVRTTSLPPDIDRSFVDAMLLEVIERAAP